MPLLTVHAVYSDEGHLMSFYVSSMFPTCFTLETMSLVTIQISVAISTTQALGVSQQFRYVHISSTF